MPSASWILVHMEVEGIPQKCFLKLNGGTSGKVHRYIFAALVPYFIKTIYVWVGPIFGRKKIVVV
jgi:hypothetical protein